VEYEEGLLTAYAIHSDMERTGQFTCENPLVDQLYRNQIWGQKSNYIEVPTDCPQRDERMGYTGDGQVVARTGAYNFDTEAFWAKFLKDIRQSQAANKEGYVAPTVPAPPGEQGIGFMSMLGWGNCICIVPEMLYWQFGTDRYIREYYDCMKTFVECEIRKMGGLLGKKDLWMAPSLGDWLATGRDVKYMAMHNGPVSNAFIVNDLRIMVWAANHLGKSDDAKRYAGQLEKTREAYIKAFVKKDGTMKDDYQGAYIMALQMVIPKGELWDKVFSKLVERLETEGMQTGFFATEHILPMLADNEQEKLAFDLLLDERCGGWMYQVKAGATTTWERWDALREDGTVNETKMSNDNMVSFNHYSFGSVGKFYYQYILGIKPAAPGFEKVRIQPYFDKRIGAFSGSFRSRNGEIKVSCNGQMLEIITPMEAEIVLHCGKQKSVEAGTYCFPL
jgi:alpha-L-rhamnosidase